MQKRQQIEQRSRLGTLLIHKGLISRQQLDDALTRQASGGGRLGEILVTQGVLTERQLKRALRRQSNYRLVAAVSAMLLGPFQPFISSANAAIDEGPAVAEQQVKRSPFQQGGMQALSEAEMGGVTAQGATDILANIDRLQDIAANPDASDEDIATTTLETLLNTSLPISNLFDAEMEIRGIEYADGPRTVMNTDGSLEVKLPTNIEEVSFRNVRVQGMQDSHLGDVTIRNLSFGAGTTVNISLRP
ncbi:hypothetical protein GCM10011297_29740 [Bacterioplanes sanyensis]|uniref:hypothetical protein n=1 Tax=Bacterioplanes sanyensis TaxID=1249553 RepID=UPI0016740FD5|nr:hypothetical protein [Bacterioplanes sanyensis]GGY54940.1 hypothetical protein GCM10011297_29740 [Bacterioplanes sanyensis]